MNFKHYPEQGFSRILSFCLLFLLLSGLSFLTHAQEISNIRVTQVGNTVNVLYDLAGEGQKFNVELFYSTDNGQTWKGPLKGVSGDAGERILPGNNKQITWNILDEEGVKEGYMQFKVIAETTEMTFQEKEIENGSMTDIEGNTYKTIKIGTQTWMAENLKTTKYNDGTSIPQVTDNSAWNRLTSGAYCWYNNDINNKATYGALYNWHAVNTAKLCPEGWHVPSDAEWTELENFLADNGYNYDGTIGGGRDKIAKSMASTTNWRSSSNTGAIGNNLSLNNSSGFSGLPGGYRSYDGYFYYVTYGGYWWSATEGSSDTAWSRHLGYDYADVSRSYSDEDGGFSVRCVRDLKTVGAGLSEVRHFPFSPDSGCGGFRTADY
jgi:uncharacterized protein (TIGR02145 family)